MQVSAGFDAHWRDPLEQLNFQSATYHKLVSGLRDLADELCGANQFLKAVKPMAVQIITEDGLQKTKSCHLLEL